MMKRNKEVTLPLPFEYNTERESVLLKEYGRIMQKMAKHILTIEDHHKRTQAAHSIIGLIKMLIPTIKDTAENNQRLWDHLYALTNMQLDVDCPYEVQEVRMEERKPQRLDPTKKQLKFRHYGRNLDILIEHACEQTDRMEQLSIVSYIGRLMKTYYASWSRDGVDDETIIEHILEMSNGTIQIDMETVKQYNMFSTLGQAAQNSEQLQASQRKNQQQLRQRSNHKKGGFQQPYNGPLPPRHKKKNFNPNGKKRI